MDTPVPKDPVQWLAYLESLCKRHAWGMPQQETTEKQWVGIGFRIGKLYFVSPLGEIVEILSPPVLTKVPGTRPWVCGIANVRGGILPVMDIQGYLYDKATETTRHTRVLVVNHKGVNSGLLVDAVLGLQHFVEEQSTDEAPPEYADVEPYLRGAFRQSDKVWRVFSMHKLAESNEFLQAAV
jgi:twitching motility protein PilI